MTNQYKSGFLDGVKMAWIEAEAAHEIGGVNETQFMLIQLALDHALDNPEFRQIMLGRYDDILEVDD